MMKPAHGESGPAIGEWLNEELAKLKNQLRLGGVAAALKFLNSHVEYRFTAIYRFQGKMQYAVYIHDRFNQPTERFNTVVMMDGFCQYITVSEPFGMRDSATDKRISEHNRHSQIRSFYGVPLGEAAGKPLGSLCHFDFTAGSLPATQECIFLNRAAGLLLTRLNGFQSQSSVRSTGN